MMRIRGLVLIILVCAGAAANAQDNYYIGTNGDTVYCVFRKIFPKAIVISTAGDRKKTVRAENIKAFKSESIEFVSKKVLNQRKDPFILLPGDKIDRKYFYSDPNLVMISGNGICFYELVEFGAPSQSGRGSIVTLYIENDTLGLKKLPTVSAVGGVGKEEVIAILREYLTADDSIREKLTSTESWKTFNYKGIRKMIEAYTGKKLRD